MININGRILGVLKGCPRVGAPYKLFTTREFIESLDEEKFDVFLLAESDEEAVFEIINKTL